MRKWKMKMNVKMNENHMVTWFDLKEYYLHIVKEDGEERM